MTIRFLVAQFAAVFVSLCASSAAAFDYLEHLWFTDDGCRRVQELLAPELVAEPDLVPAYLALALACPASWEQPYCVDGAKTATAHLNMQTPNSSGYSATLGDFSALGDHVSRQGPIRNLPRARTRGLVHDLLKWLTAAPGGVRGVVKEIGKGVCETRGLADFPQVRRDVDDRLSAWWKTGRIASVPSGQLPEVMREPIPRGPHDTPMTYSFYNPHYLDLVLRNHHHFGEGAHDAWNGFHGAATRMTARTCAELVVVDADKAGELARGVPGYERVDWDTVAPKDLGVRVCAMLGEVVRARLEAWQKVAPRALAEPAAAAIAGLADDFRLMDRIVVRLLSLVFEGTGLHYLQDGLAGGHMRTIRSREALVEVRHDHDADNRDGVAAVIETPNGTAAFVAWGDGYLLGRSPASHCDWGSSDAAVTSTCLLAQQRGLVAAATISSLIDWAYGGAVYRGLECDAGLERAICMALPVAAPRVAGTPHPELVTLQLLPGSLPVPPPDFSFESFSVAFGLDPWATAQLLSARFATFREMDIPAHWLRSWQLRLETSLGSGVHQSLSADLGFGFHYRFYARVMLDLVPVILAGFRDFGAKAHGYAGVAPRIGLTALPEGWLKIPMEFTLFVDSPFVLFSTDTAPFSELADTRPRFTMGFGLAFMH